MSNNIESTARSKFFPNSKTAPQKTSHAMKSFMDRNELSRKEELDSLTRTDATVKIPDAVKDFARIKKAVDLAPEIDNSDKIAKLRSQIKSGTYNVDYEALADKILASEF